jgi:metal-dependent amidase/aminoacylase/carboxypeptidase family protein
MAIGDTDVIAAVAAQRPMIADTVAFVHAHPELAHAEHRCAGHLVGRLRDAGLHVEEGVAGLGTAFRAALAGGRAGRRVGIVALYDAVAAVREDGSLEAVHSCGHGPIAGAVVGAALALASLREQLAGELVAVGCPADEIHAPGSVERGGGKWLTAAAGVWDEFDAALYVHPEFIDTVWQASLWMRRDTFVVAGARSLRDGVAQPPIDAIDRLLRAAAGVSRAQLMIERLVLDGDVEEGTGLVLTGTLLCFADDEAGIERTALAMRSALPDAAWRAGRLVPGIRPDARVTAAVADAFAAAGRGFEPDPPPLPFATDFGSISRRAPAALIGVGRSEGWAFHSDEGAAQFASPAGVDVATDMATVLALATVRLSEPSPSLGGHRSAARPGLPPDRKRGIRDSV